MFSHEFIPHRGISQEALEAIIQIKSVAWPYPFDRQIEWIGNNLKDSDFHLLLFDEDRAVAYLNIIDIEMTIDDCQYKSLGIGNVCSAEKGKGYGSELMSRANRLLINDNKIGLLFCKQSLVRFYEKSEWNIIDKLQLCLSFDNKEVETMIFNLSKPLSKLSYMGRAF